MKKGRKPPLSFLKEGDQRLQGWILQRVYHKDARPLQMRSQLCCKAQQGLMHMQTWKKRASFSRMLKRRLPRPAICFPLMKPRDFPLL
ncbi:hypothetical protein WJX75_002249 [Coccomyxa subellipsoidea]|uniref:Uncharacterized protein n=1 Tax=Coccomyxa subellipsoidea TaxID=248742 RepID=A0ABR2YMI6_9CHLO